MKDDLVITNADQKKPRMILNPNQEVVNKIISRIYKCDGYCPCQPREEGKDTRCPCPDKNQGNCHCKLFVPEE